MNLGSIILKAREDKGWNLTEAAKKIGVVKSQLLCWERSDYLPTKRNLKKLCRGYRLSYEDLVRVASVERYS